MFFKYQFQSFTLTFDTKEGIKIYKPDDPTLFPDKAEKDPDGIYIEAIPATDDRQPFYIQTAAVSRALNQILPFLEPAGPDLWLDNNLEDIVPTSVIIDRYNTHIPASMRKLPEIPDWLNKFIDSSDCRLIETQRLLRIVRSNDPHRVSRRGPTLSKAVVDAEASDLANRIRATLAEYANQSQALDQSFPRRVIVALGSQDAPLADDVSRRLRDVEQKRSSLIEAGLLDKSGAPEILSQAELRGKEVRQVIGVYLNDMEQKFSKFDQLFQRASLFKEIISEKFRFKSVMISREKGISARMDDGQEIPLTDLSSGEQHELVLLYELLFGVRDDALILIDEPELSLHVGWQVKFIPDLERIQKLRSLQIIMATHSPQIINDRWDLTEELKG